MQENADQYNSEYGHLSRGVKQRAQNDFYVNEIKLKNE